MHHSIPVRALLLAATVALASVAAVADADARPTAPDTLRLHDDLGRHHYPVTATPEAQRWFDQGLRLYYGFNHAEAVRSFRRGAEIDPGCAMCRWGEALAHGPNINLAMDVEAARAARAARAAADEALRRLEGVSLRERDLVRALDVRYAPDPGASDESERARRDSAWAEAMAEVSTRHPEDDEAAVLHAEARMLLGPWDYWHEDDTPKPHGRRALDALEPVIERSPEHPGACHFFIHAVEAAFPERAVPCAERLPELMPGAGHLVHMPAHVYIRVGRYADAIDRNRHALHADERHLPDMAPDGVYRLAYHPHNAHFLTFAATMIGRSEEALEGAFLTREKVDRGLLDAPGFGALQHYDAQPLFVMVRFGLWDRILADPAPREDLPYLRGLHHYARALARLGRGEGELASEELAALDAALGDPRLEGVTLWDMNPMSDLLRIAARVVRGEAAAVAGDHEAAVAHLREAVRIEDSLAYDEPPPWHLPVRQRLGAVLLEADRPLEAEEAYRRDLRRHPENGWSLFGLARALEAQGRTEEATEVRERFERAWATADVRLTASRF